MACIKGHQELRAYSASARDLQLLDLRVGISRALRGVLRELPQLYLTSRTRHTWVGGRVGTPRATRCLSRSSEAPPLHFMVIPLDTGLAALALPMLAGLQLCDLRCSVVGIAPE